MIRLKGDAVADRVARDAAQHLGSGVARQAPPQEAESIESFRRGEPWMRAGETLELSRRESKVLGRSLAAKVGQSIQDKEHLRRLESILEEEYFALFTRIHDGELSLADALERGGAQVEPRVQRRLLEFLPPDQTKAVMEALHRKFFGGN